MSFSEKHRAGKRASLPERLARFAAEKLESEEIAPDKVPSAEHPACDIPLDEALAQRKDELSSLKKAAAERDERVAKLDEVLAQREIVTTSQILQPGAASSPRSEIALEQLLKHNPSIGQGRTRPQKPVLMRMAPPPNATRGSPYWMRFWPSARVNLAASKRPAPNATSRTPYSMGFWPNARAKSAASKALLAIIGDSLARGLGAGVIVFAVCIFGEAFISFDGFYVGTFLGPYAFVIGTFLAGLCQIRRVRTLPTWGFVGYGLFLLLGLFLICAGYLLIFLIF